MSGICNALLNGGTNQECQIAASEIKNVIITRKKDDVKFSYSDKKVLTNWTDKIKQDLSISVLPGLVNYTPTTDDVNIITNPVSKAKSANNNPVPSFEFMLDSNFCDFQEILNTLKGGNYGIFFEMQNGNIEGWQDKRGTEIGYFKPFLAQVKSYTKGAQEIDSNESFKLLINFKKYSQIEQAKMFYPAWGVDELQEAMPEGMNMESTTIFAADDQNVQINVRCSDGQTGLVLADFETSTTMSNVSTPAVTGLVENGGGDYDLTIQKDLIPASLVAGDLVGVRVNKINGSDTLQLSGWVTVEGV